MEGPWAAVERLMLSPLWLQLPDRTGVSQLYRVFHLPGPTEHVPPAEPDDRGTPTPSQATPWLPTEFSFGAVEAS